MLNKERPEVIDTLYNSLLDGDNIYRSDILCTFCTQVGAVVTDTEELENWLNSEYVEPYKITQTEKNILETLNPSYWIGRDSQKDLELYIDKPDTSITKDYWVEDYLYSFEVYNELFPFIEEMHCYKIKDILENCEVID